MPDRDWPSPADPSSFRLVRSGLTVTTVDPGRLTLIAGAVDDALAVYGLGAANGWPGQASGERYAVRTGIDRALLVGPAIAGGWHGRFGATEVSDGLVTFVLDGPALPAALACLAEVSLERPTPSAGLLIAGYRIVLYRHEAALRLHVARPLAPAFGAQLAVLLDGLPA